MGIDDRRARERAARRRLIVATARRLAEAHGWDTVTTRRLSAQIEYSQPVLYKHFPGMDAIAAAVAVEGFGELADVLSRARAHGAPEGALARLGRAYLEFARANPATYEAMFVRAGPLSFAAPDTPPELSAAFGELRAAVAALVPEADRDTVAEVIWAALHGLVMLGRSGRLRPGLESERVDLLAAQFGAYPT